MSRKRIVVTGLSAYTPLGLGLEPSWDALLRGESGIGPITFFDTAEYPARIAGELKDFKPEDHMPAKDARRMDRFAQIAVAAGLDMLKGSGYIINDDNARRVGCMLGVGLGGLQTIEFFHEKLMASGPNRVSPFMIPMLISNIAPGQLSISTGAKGTNLALTSACSSGLHAIGYAFSEILLGRCDAVITGGVESTITPLGVAGFTALKALSTSRNDDPTRASRPFDKDRDGFVMGEGGGFLLLESLDSALKRGAKIYAEVCGFGATADAFHITAPDENGEGLANAMRLAVEEGGIALEDVDHINAHGTSTYLNDLIETKAIKAVFGERAYDIAICANKSQTGHLLGAAGGMESVFTIMALHTGVVPGTLNYETPDPECDLNYMGGGAQKLDPRYALCNSAGFGGTNASILFKKYEA